MKYRTTSENLHLFLDALAVVCFISIMAALFYFSLDDDCGRDVRNAQTAFYPSRPSVEQQNAYREEMQAQADLIRATSTTPRGAQ